MFIQIFFKLISTFLPVELNYLRVIFYAVYIHAHIFLTCKLQYILESSSIIVFKSRKIHIAYFELGMSVNRCAA